MTSKNCFLLLLLLLCQSVLGQRDTIVLQQVLISDSQLKTFSGSRSVLQLNDSIINKNSASLTGLLNLNSTIYFKENGLGMVASPAFRGTTAQQTAVIWNGININSQLNGQTDFNTINAANYNAVSIRPGGGSPIYGSGAIGGSIHLNNELPFGNLFSNALRLRYGSYATINADYQLRVATKKTSAQFSVSRNSSDNDYRYPDTNLYNENGQFDNTSLNVNFGYKFDAQNVIRFYSQVFDGTRHFSGTLAAPSKSKYTDSNTRSLLEFAHHRKYSVSRFKLAYLSEWYKYFEDKDQPGFSFGQSQTAIGKYDFAYRATEKIDFNSLLDYTHTRGNGSDLGTNSRDIFSIALLMKHQLTRSFLYELGLKQELTANYKSPLLYSFGTSYRQAKAYAVKFNFSKNFRIPSFNDLYWTVGGNEDLKPESALQFDCIHEFSFRDLGFSVSGFYNKITDLISWKPSENGQWQPINTNKVRTYGLEAHLRLNKKILQNHNLKLQLNYGYTVSENEQTRKQLMYVPYHKFTSNLAYAYKGFTFYATYLFNGAVYTSLDNAYRLKEYSVVNSGMDYELHKSCSLGFGVQNVLDQYYLAVAQRPFPGRNYHINININL